MRNVIVQKETSTCPISLIGKEAGICWGANTADDEKNFERGLKCIEDNHGRTLEYPQIYLVIEGYSAKVIRELYTHIGGSPTRLQASTRYINYNNFDFVMPHSINTKEKQDAFIAAINQTRLSMEQLKSLGVPNEDFTMLLPLCMETKIVLRTNLRNLVDMSRQRMCNRAYWEFRELFNDILKVLSGYSFEWNYLINDLKLFKPKCEELGYCPESKGCGRYEKKQERTKGN